MAGDREDRAFVSLCPFDYGVRGFIRRPLADLLEPNPPGCSRLDRLVVGIPKGQGTTRRDELPRAERQEVDWTWSESD